MASARGCRSTRFWGRHCQELPRKWVNLLPIDESRSTVYVYIYYIYTPRNRTLIRPELLCVRPKRWEVGKEC